MDDWNTYENHFLGFDLSLRHPRTWVPNCQASDMVIIFAEEPIGEAMPYLNIVRKYERRKTLEQFTNESLKELNRIGIVEKVTETKLSCHDARSVVYSISNLMRCHQIWASVGDSVIIFTFIKEISLWEPFTKIIKKILQSVIIGPERQEHVILKTYMIPGLNKGETIQIRCPHTWVAETQNIEHVNKTGILCTFSYEDSQCSNRVVLSYDNSNPPKSLGEYQRLLKFQLEKMLDTSGSPIIIEECQLGSLPAQRALCSLDVKNRLLLYYALYREAGELEKSPSKGLLFLRCEYSHNPKNNSALDIIQRIAASILIMEDNQLDEDLFTYENLSWGFGFQYNCKKSQPRKFGTSMKLVPVVPVQLPTVDPNAPIPGEFITIIRPIVTNVDDMSLDIFIQDAITLIKEDDKRAIIKQRKVIRTKNLIARSIIVQPSKEPDQCSLTFACRKEDFWFIVRWSTTTADFDANVRYIDSVFESYYFFKV